MSRLSIVTGRTFIPTKLTRNCGGIHPNPNPRWLLDYAPLFSTRIFHIFEPRATGDIPSYAPPRGVVDDKGNITSWPFVFNALQELHFQVEFTVAINLLDNNPLFYNMIKMVSPLGIEPRTYGLKVRYGYCG